MKTPHKIENFILSETRIEKYSIGDKLIFVKREDQCAPISAPPFSKIRGLMAYMQMLKTTGIHIVGYVETSISMAGWGVAWAAKKLDMRAVIYDPQYKTTPSLLKYHRRQWNKFHAEIVKIPAGRAKVNWYICKKHLKETYGPFAVLLPLGLPLPETVLKTAQEVQRTLNQFTPAAIVVCIGSGTIGAGIWKGTSLNQMIYGILSRTGDLKRKRAEMAKKAQVFDRGLFGKKNLKLIDPGWGYADICPFPAPFPCHPYYDRKAWKWLVENYAEIPKPVLFWNIGSILRRKESQKKERLS